MEIPQKLLHVPIESLSSEVNKSNNFEKTASSVEVEVKFIERTGNLHHETSETDLVNEDSCSNNLIKKGVSGEFDETVSVSSKKYLSEAFPESCNTKYKPCNLKYLYGTELESASYSVQANEKPPDIAEENPAKTCAVAEQQVLSSYATAEKPGNNSRRGRRVPFITLSRPDKKCQKSGQTKALTDIPGHHSKDFEHVAHSTGSLSKTGFGNLEGIFIHPVIEKHSSLPSVSKEKFTDLSGANNGKHHDFQNVNVAKPHIYSELSELNSVSSCTAQNISSENASLSSDKGKLLPNPRQKIFKPSYQCSTSGEISLKKQFGMSNQFHDYSNPLSETSKLDDLAQIAASVSPVDTYKVTEGDSHIKSSSASPSGRTQKKKLEQNRKVAQLIGDENFVATSSTVCGVQSGLQEVHVENRTVDSRKRKSTSDTDSVVGMSSADNDIDSLLEVAAQRNKLSRTNVKNILKHVMTNDYVLAMVRNTMKPEDENDDKGNSGYEPKLTRSKVKELREKKAQLPWLVSSPAKQSNNTGTIKLLQEEFSDRDSTSDEEYKPNEEEEGHSDEEENTLDSSAVEIVTASPLTPVKQPPRKKQSDLLEEHPLVIAETAASPVSNAANEADRIALRTRSKLPLNDTPLEAIEASFIAPDITVDMYDTDCDDEEWRKFLCDFAKPLDTKVLEDQPDDDAEDDPEYNFLEEEDVLDDCDVTYDKDLKIPRKELKALMREILEAAEQELLDIEEEEESDVQPAPSIWFPAKEHVCERENTFQMLSRSMTDHEKLQLQEQMRMHVQMLCQTYLLSRDNPFFVNFGYCAKDMLVELKTLADRELSGGKVSSFRAANLEGAVKIVNEFALDNNVTNICEVTKPRKSHGIRSNKAKKTMAFDKTFIYPDLLPFCSFRRYIETTKPVFTLAEDNLIALGLEQFSEMQRHIHLIHEYLLPTKTEQQIRFRIKNAKSMKYSAEHPIRYFFIHGKCPPFPSTVRPFDPKDVKVPAEMPADSMPKWMRPFLIRQYVPLAPILSSPKPKSTVMKLPLLLTPEKRHYSPILPRGSPMKQVIPILRKYGQHRRSIILTSPTKRIPRFTKKPTRPPLRITAKRKILPKISNSDNIMPGIKVPCINSASIEVPCNKRARSDASSDVGSSIGISDCKENPYVSESPLDVSVPLSEDPSNHTVPENESQNEIETCEEGEDEALDDEQDLAALMVASSTICKKQQPVVRKKNRHQKDVESTLALLSPDLMESDPKKAEREDFFAQSYLVRALEILKNDPGRLERFLMTVLKFENKENSVAILFEEMEDILRDHSSLLYDFIGFLSAEQAKECGKYVEYLTLAKIRSFLRKIEVHFLQQPQQIQKIIRAFSQLNQQPDLTSESVIRTLQPLLRNQSHLLEELSQLLPDDHPPESMMTDFEDITIPDSDMDHSSADSFEDIIIPETADPYGGKDCPCSCHLESSDVRMQNRNRHCAKCGTKFLDGRVYIQTGKVLKPAQVIYHATVELHSDSQKQQKQSTSSTAACKTNSRTPREVDSPLSSPTCSPHPSQCVENVQQQLAENSKVTSSKQTPSLGPNTVCARKGSHLTQTSSVISSLHTSAGSPLLSKSPSPEKTLQRALEDHLDDVSVPALQCPVIEDAVLPPDSSNKLSSVPSDFSHLKDVIRSGCHSPKRNVVVYPIMGEVAVAAKVSPCESYIDHVNCSVNTGKQKNDSSKIKLQSSAIASGDVFFSGQQSDTAKEDSALGYKITCHSSSSVPCETSGIKWTRNEDAIILNTCKEEGLCEETFSVISQSITDKNIHQIKSRLEELLQLYKRKVKRSSSAESQE